MIAGTLEVQLMADVARLRQDVQQATGVVNQFARDAVAAVDKVKVAVGAVSGALAGVAAIHAFVEHIRGAIELADQLNKLSQRTGIATEALSQLRFAAKLADVSNESLVQGLKKLNVSINEGLAGDKQKAEAFENMGIKLRDAKGEVLSADKVLLQIADRFSEASDGAVKTAYAVALMGKAGDEMIPLLNGGGNAIRELMDKANKLGLTISKEFAAQAEEFNDNLTIIETSGHRLAVTLGSELVAALGDIIKKMADASVEGGKLHGIFVGLQELDRKIFGTTPQDIFQRRAVDGLRKDLTEAQGKLAEMSGEWNKLGAIQKAQLPEVKAALDRQTAKVNQLTEALGKARAAYLVLNSNAGAGRSDTSMFKDPRLLGPVPAITAKRELKPLGGNTPTSSAGAQVSEYEALIKRIKERINLADEELRQQRELTDFEKFASKVETDAAQAKHALSAAQRQNIRDSLEQARVSELAVQVQRSELALAKQVASERQQRRTSDDEQAAQALRDINDAYAQTLKSVKDREQSMRDEAEATKLAGQENISLAEAVERVAIARLEERRVLLQDGGEAAKAVDNEIKARRELLQLVHDRSDLDRFRDVWQSIDRTAQQVFTDIFNGGKSAFTRLRDTLKSTVLDLLYQLTVRPIVLNLVANLTGTSMTSALGAIGGLGGIGGGGSGGGLLSLLGSAGNAITGGGILGGVSNFIGTSIANLTGGGLDAFLATNGAFGTAGGISGALGALGPIGLVAGGALLLSSVFGKKRGGPKQESGFGPDVPHRGDPGLAKGIVDNITQQYLAIAGDKALKDIQFGAFVASDPQGKALTQLMVNSNLNGVPLSGRGSRFGGNVENVGRSDEELQAAITEETERVVLRALQETHLPDVVGKFLKELGTLDSLTATEIDTATKRLAKIVTERQTLEAKLFDLEHTDLEKAAAAREKERQAIDEVNRALYDHVALLTDLRAQEASLRDQLVAAFQREGDALRDVISRSRDFAKQFRQLRDSLLLGADSSVSPRQRAALAGTRFDATLTGAIAGNEDDLSALGTVSTDFLDAIRSTSASRVEMATAFAKVQAGLTSAAAASDARASVAQLQLDAMTKQLTELGIINNTVQSVGNLLAALLDVQNKIGQENLKYQAAQAAQSVPTTPATGSTSTQAAAQETADQIRARLAPAFTSTTPEWTSFTGDNDTPTVHPAVTTVDQVGLDAAVQAELARRAAAVPAFAAGGLPSGLSLVGERGPELVDFREPARVYTADQTRGMFSGGGSAVEALLRDVLQELRNLRTEGRTADVAVVNSLQKSEKVFRKWDADGLPATRV